MPLSLAMHGHCSTGFAQEHAGDQVLAALPDYTHLPDSHDGWKLKDLTYTVAFDCTATLLQN